MIDNKKLEAFMFIILRDYLRFGEIELILKDIDKIHADNLPHYDEKHIYNYCKKIVERFKSKDIKNNYDKLIEVLKEKSENFDETFEAGEYWDSGNFDDCFQLGQESGRNEIYGEIKDIVSDIS